MTFGNLEDIAEFKPQVLIAGAGPTALGACLPLIRSGVKVLLVTGGSAKIAARNQELAQGSDLIQRNHESLDTNRVRASGGTSHLWGGRCVPLDETDFASRTWLTIPSWPITHSEISKNYSAAAQILGTLFPEPPIDVLVGENANLTGLIDSQNLESWTKEQNIFAFHRKELTASENVLVLEDVHLTDLLIDLDATRLTGAVLSKDGMRNLEVSISRVVLATGAIENSRLLLLLKQKSKSLFPKSANFIGSNYMTHPIVSMPYFELRENLDLEFQKVANQNVRRRISLTANVQQDLRIGNAAAFLAREAPDLGSFLGAGKELSNAISKYGKDLPRKIWNYRKQILKTFKTAFSSSTQTHASPKSSATLHVISEHFPNSTSKISLGNRLDRFGNQLPNATLEFCELDRITLVRTAKKLAELLARSEADYLAIDWKAWELRAMEVFDNPSSHAHMLGGTPMSESADTGVTDSWGELHELAGLYCTGTSLFVTSGQANPTLAAVALALRTASRISTQIQGH